MEPRWIAQEIRVPPEHAGKRLDRFLQCRFPWRSRAWIQRLLERHGRDDTGRPLKPSRSVRAGESIRLYFEVPDEPPVPDTEIRVLYEDDLLYAIDKPAGLPVHARGKQRSRAIIHLLRRRNPTLHLDLAHRLDRETSGVLICTKDRAANAEIKRQLREGLVRKEYLAIVHGRVDADAFTVDLPLRPARGSAIRMKMETHPDGAPALTEVRVLRRFRDYTLLSARPRTGRQHQIRAHLAALGHRVVGDKIYGVPEEVFLRFDSAGLDDALLARLELPRHALHAAAVDLRHPGDGRSLRVQSPLPSDLADFLSGLAAGA